MKTLRMTLISLCALLLAACASQQQHDQQAPALQVQSDDRVLRDRLQVVDLQSRYVGDLQQLQVKLANTWAFEIAVQYQIKWFNQQGFEIEPESRPWLPLVIGGKSEARVQAVAPNASAVSYELWVRD